MKSGKVLIAQGGGPTAVINQSLVGAVLEAQRYAQVDRIYGAVHGVRGIVDENFMDLSMETAGNLERVAAMPSSALGSTRDKPDRAYCAEMFKVLKAHDIRSFFYCGGNDSSDTVRIVKEFADEANYEFTAMHIPKTIDNDLMANDHTPGFPSAAKFVACAFAGVNMDNRALPGVYVGVVMGRHAGFLTGAAAMARVFADDGPHLIYVPERTFDMNTFLADVKSTYDKYGRCIVAVSEGVHDAEGTPIVTKLQENVERDAHGNVQLSGTGALADLLCDEIKAKLGIKRVRGDTFGYLQRSFLGIVSEVDAREAREVGQKAVQEALRHNASGTITIKRVGNYASAYELANVKEVAALTKVMADNFITTASNDVTADFIHYLRPLLGSNPLEHAARLMAPMVEKILHK
ncbi:6-phosphofructokinase [Magnetococcus marinus MC-1]|uniref:Pyrophosphate--fructose 6-phosphate 1-phosphotransferase n=1 Tax=Magnetococcus marinus (strain ATCC BAA-1437 / JCM 17883 / MC-1) TaxID=156889 RepID=A0L8Y2_MAGMM|nr:6-phosphofructokinase [Magnetococcus marinus]ABK44425.1 6-phosphofructokinase [Magnetococcus marinus MC-1]